MASGIPVKIEQLDYYTQERIGEYETIGEAADDNWILHSTLSMALKKGKGTAVFKNKKLMFRKITV